VVALKQPTTAEQIKRWSPSGRVPVLTHDAVTVWDSLAIAEYLNETFPEAGLWPASAGLRAHARSVSAEMHAGFAALRTELPYDLRRHAVPKAVSPEAQADIDRVQAIWRQCRGAAVHSGPFLFGAFSIADAMFAPVVGRFRSYAVPMDAVSAAYAEAVVALPALVEWTAAAQLPEAQS
jgi:glutathione S-transferase